MVKSLFSVAALFFYLSSPHALSMTCVERITKGSISETTRSDLSLWFKLLDSGGDPHGLGSESTEVWRRIEPFRFAFDVLIPQVALANAVSALQPEARPQDKEVGEVSLQTLIDVALDFTWILIQYAAHPTFEESTNESMGMTGDLQVYTSRLASLLEADREAYQLALLSFLLSKDDPVDWIRYVETELPSHFALSSIPVPSKLLLGRTAFELNLERAHRISAAYSQATFNALVSTMLPHPVRIRFVERHLHFLPLDQLETLADGFEFPEGLNNRIQAEIDLLTKFRNLKRLQKRASKEKRKRKRELKEIKNERASLRSGLALASIDSEPHQNDTAGGALTRFEEIFKGVRVVVGTPEELARIQSAYQTALGEFFSKGSAKKRRRRRSMLTGDRFKKLRKKLISSDDLSEKLEKLKSRETELQEAKKSRAEKIPVQEARTELRTTIPPVTEPSDDDSDTEIALDSITLSEEERLALQVLFQIRASEVDLEAALVRAFRAEIEQHKTQEFDKIVFGAIVRLLVRLGPDLNLRSVDEVAVFGRILAEDSRFAGDGNSLEERALASQKGSWMNVGYRHYQYGWIPKVDDSEKSKNGEAISSRELNRFIRKAPPAARMFFLRLAMDNKWLSLQQAEVLKLRQETEALHSALESYSP